MSQVSKDSEWVASISKMVKVDETSLERFTSLLLEKIRTGSYRSVDWSLDNPLHPNSDKANVLDWIFLVDSLNFSFWPTYNQHYSINNQVGYWALCVAINRAEDENIPIVDPEYYKNITLEDAKKIFRTDQGDVEVPLLKERLEIMRYNGRILCERFGGTFKNVLQEASGSAQKLLNLVCEHFPSFRDEATIQGRRIKILKRAQILVADIWGCFHGKNEGHFDDIDSLTIFADYRIPQALHYFGVLQYSDELLKKLEDNRNILENGSQEEVEIRCNAIHAIELIRSRMLKEHAASTRDEHFKIPNSIEIDFYIWGFRRDNAEEIDRRSPYHKVRCIYY